MSDVVYSTKPNTDTLRAIVVTRFYSLEGDIHFPKIGKEGRRLTNMLNSNKKFIAMTNVQVTYREHHHQEPQYCPFIQVNTEAIEYIQPYIDDKVAE